MTSSPVLAILKLQHEKVRISMKNKLMSKISSYGCLVSGLARLVHTRTRALATRGRAPPKQVRMRIIGADSIVVDCELSAKRKSNSAVSESHTFTLRWESMPRPPKCFCTLRRISYKRAVLMLCPSIGDVLATPLCLVLISVKYYKKFLTWDRYSARGCASQTPREARSRVGTHSDKLWSYTRNWAKSRGWALLREWALFRKTTVKQVW